MPKQYININGNILKVKNYDPEKELKSGFAYIKGKLVYPFKGFVISDYGSGKQLFNGVGVYIDQFRDHIFIKPIGDKAKSKYKAKNVYSIDENYISDVIDTEGLKDVFDEALTAEINEIFSPAIDEDDNRLQRIIKHALVHKKIDIKNYEGRFKSPTDSNNCRRSLIKHGTMSMDKFEKWAQILDLGFTITFFDKKGCPNPMNIIGVIKDDGSYEEISDGDRDDE